MADVNKTDVPMFRAGEWAAAEWVGPSGYIYYLTACIKRWEALGEWKQAEQVRAYRRRFVEQYGMFLIN